MAFTRLFREASTGLTSNLGGSAATPNAGANNWITPVSSSMVRRSAGGFEASGGSYLYNALNAGDQTAKVVIVADGITAGHAASAEILFALSADADTQGASSAYWGVFWAVGSFVNFKRVGTGAGTAEIYVNTPTLDKALPWTITIERTSASTWAVTVTDGTTTVGPTTWTDDGAAGTRPAGTWFDQFGRSGAVVTDLDVYKEVAGGVAGSATTTATATGTVTSVKRAQGQLVDRNGNPRANLSGLSWAFFDFRMPSDIDGAPSGSGTDFATDASGNYAMPIPGSTLSVGQRGYLIVSNSDGTDADNPLEAAFARRQVVS